MRSRPALFRLPVALLAASQVLAACQRQPPAQPAPEAAAPVAAPPAAPRAPAMLDRAKLLQALDDAAAAYGAGRANDGESLAGRRFAIRQAFGCQGPVAVATPGVARWTWSRDRKAIEISLEPADWTEDGIFNRPGQAWEAVEGAWITRPWTRDETCPAPAPTQVGPTQVEPTEAADKAAVAKPSPGPAPVLALPPMADRQVAGLAAVFAHGGSRVGRRDGKPYAFSLRAEGDAPLSAPVGGYRLVIEGRLTAFPDGRAIQCRTSSPDIRPTCLAAAEVDRVAFENYEGKLLREWRPG